MAIQTSYPGVYIEEFAPAAPIEGVGTNTAAFIGVAAAGELDTPVKVTSWDQFRAAFGDQPLPGFYLWYAVRGFFENGGQVCYVVRASNAEYARLTPPLENRAQLPMLNVQARKPGVPSPALSIAVAEAHVLPPGDYVYRPDSATYTAVAGRDLTVDATELPRFKATDWVTLGGGTDRFQVQRVIGNVLRLASDPPPGLATPGEVRLAFMEGSRTLRLQPPKPLPANALVPGTVLSIAQGPVSDVGVVESAQLEPVAGEDPTYRVTFRQPLTGSFNLGDPAATSSVQSEEINITVTQGPPVPYNNLGVDPAHPLYFLSVINGDPGGRVLLELIEPPPATALTDSILAATPANVALTGGADEDLAGLTSQHYAQALETLREIDDVNLVAVPDAVTLRNAQGQLDEPAITSLQQEVIAHCEQLADRFAVLDARPGLPLFHQTASIQTQRKDLESQRGYAALYYPWLRVMPAGPGGLMLAPPSGHVCGVIARSDASRGVHKAPANEIVNGALGVETAMSDVDQGQLNLAGINVIRVFSGGRPMLWGARTTATDKNWQYVNVRRLFLFLEESIQEGIRGAVFEPNNPGLWAKLSRTLTEFLTRVWRDGALFGNTAKEAFYVRIDETLNPDSSRALGRLYIEIGVRPSYPAEFIIVRIGIWQGGSEVSEA
jgi:uncharacterized protein